MSKTILPYSMHQFMDGKPMYVSKRMPKKVAREMKDFKLRVALGLHNALQIQENAGKYYLSIKSGNGWVRDGLHVTIGNAHFIFYPHSEKEVEKVLKQFKTTVW